MAKLNFQQALLQSSVSHDPSEIIWVVVNKPFVFIIIIIINVENSLIFLIVLSNDSSHPN